MNNKILYGITFGIVVIIGLLVYLAVKNDYTPERIKAEQEVLIRNIQSLEKQVQTLSDNLQTLQENEKDTVKYYFTNDRFIVNLDRVEQSGLFTTNTKELLDKERAGYFDSDNPK